MIVMKTNVEAIQTCNYYSLYIFLFLVVWVPVFVGIIAAIVISLLSMYYCHKRR